MLEQYKSLLDQDFYYNTLYDTGIAPDIDFGSGVDLSQMQRQITDDLIASMNDFFDGLGKTSIAGAEEVEALGESATDLARAIADKDPRFAVDAVLEAMGVEFDKDGNVDMKNTIVDNVRPLIQKMMARYVINPVKGFIKSSLGFSEEEAALLEE